MLESARERNPLPEGTVSVGAGLVVAGASAYLFTAIAQRAVGEGPYAAVGQLWFLTWLVIPGLLLPIEQEVGRALSHRRTLGEGGLPVAQKAAVLSATIVVGALIVSLATSPLLVDELFQGDWLLLAGLLIAIVGYAAAHFARGVMAGTGQFRRYGLLYALDGSGRVFLAAVAWAAGIDSIGVYALIVGFPPYLAVWLGTKGKRDVLTPGPPTSWSEIAPNLGWLLAGSLCAAAIIQAPPLLANLYGDQSAATTLVVSAFTNGVLVARVPLFLFQAVQAALLPKLARLAAAGRYDEFRRGFWRLLFVVAGIGALGILGAGVLGPFVVQRAYPTEVDLSHRTMALLALGFSVYMAALALAQALIALHKHTMVAVGWGIGVLTSLLVSAVATEDVLLRVELGLVSAAVLALGFFGYVLQSSLRHGDQLDPEELLAVISDAAVEP